MRRNRQVDLRRHAQGNGFQSPLSDTILALTLLCLVDSFIHTNWTSPFVI